MKTEILVLMAGLGASGALSACDSPDPTFAVIDNQAQMAVYEGWWSVTLFSVPVPAGAVGDPERAVTSTETAYALLAPAWDPTSGTPPTTLIPVMSAQELHAAHGDTLHIVVSDATMLGNCAAGKPLSQEQADIITQSIFPGPFTGKTYDAATCVTTMLPSVDAGDAGTD